MIEADRADYDRAKLNHDLIVSITTGSPKTYGSQAAGQPDSWERWLLSFLREHETQVSKDRTVRSGNYSQNLIVFVTTVR